MPLAAATPPAATAGAGSAAVRLPGPWSLGATAGWLLMAFVAYASISIAAGALYRVLASYGVVQSFAFATGAGFLLTVDIAAECAAFAVVVLAVRRSGLTLTDYFGLTAPHGRYVLASAATLIAPVFVGLILLPAIGLHISDGTRAPDPFASPVATLIVLRWFSSGVMAPLWEEALMRGFLYRGLAASRLGPAGAIAVTAVLWALMHLGSGRSWIGIAEMTLAGLLFGWLRWRTGSLLPTIAVHAANNLLMLALIALL